MAVSLARPGRQIQQISLNKLLVEGLSKDDGEPPAYDDCIQKLIFRILSTEREKPGLISTQGYESLQYQAGDIAVDAQLVHFRLETSEI